MSKLLEECTELDLVNALQELRKRKKHEKSVTISERLRAIKVSLGYRQAHGLNQIQLAQKLGINATHLSYVECGSFRASPCYVKQILTLEGDAE